ncbi:MAG: DUF1697 domain-containing protein [Gemmatimonadales bacterium]
MKKRQSRFIALLRGINVSGHNMIPMSELRSLCGDLGWSGVETYIQSGNVVFSSGATAKFLELEIEQSIEQRFGHSISVIVRSVSEWPAYIEGNPFVEASRTEPNRVMMALSKLPPRPDAVSLLRERAVHGEELAQVDDALWIHYGDGVAKSKLSPALLHRLVGSPVTARNWRTVLKLGEMAMAPPQERG